MADEFIKVLAYHEAGHAVLAWRLKVPLKELKIDASGGICMNSLIISPMFDPELTSQKDRAQVENRALILLGGEMAELLCSEMADLSGDGTTAELFRDAYLTSNESVVAGSDREELRELAQLIFGSLGPNATSWIRRIEVTAQDELVEHWHRVSALANTLITRRVLSGLEATRLIEDA